MNGVNHRVRAVGDRGCRTRRRAVRHAQLPPGLPRQCARQQPAQHARCHTEYEQPRGAIISADGVTLAQSVPSNDQYKYQRVYPRGALFGQMTGYFSFTYGTDGLESEYNSVLTQTRHAYKAARRT